MKAISHKLREIFEAFTYIKYRKLEKEIDAIESAEIKYSL